MIAFFLLINTLISLGLGPTAVALLAARNPNRRLGWLRSRRWRVWRSFRHCYAMQARTWRYGCATDVCATRTSTLTPRCVSRTRRQPSDLHAADREHGRPQCQADLVHMRINLVDTGCDRLGESPIWDDAAQHFSGSIILGRRIRRYEPESGSVCEWHAPDVVGSIGLGQEGVLIAAMRDGFIASI